jgi:hypothetical protein
LPSTDWQCRVRCMWAAGCAKAGRGTTGREATICAACKHRCICEAQARGRKRDSQTDHHDGDLWHMCRRTTGERRWDDQDGRFDTAKETRQERVGEGSRQTGRVPRAAHFRPGFGNAAPAGCGGQRREIFLGGIVVVAAVVGRAGRQLGQGLLGSHWPAATSPTRRLDPDDSARSRMAHELGVAVETGQENKNSNPPALWFFLAVAVGLRRAFRAFGLRNYLPE